MTLKWPEYSLVLSENIPFSRELKSAAPAKQIIHIDMDCFYAAVEMRDQPRLKHVPLAIGGKSPRSVLCTANYHARKYGVKAALPSVMALKLCPDLVILPPDFKKYKKASEEIHKVFRMFTSEIQPLSLDEAYLDVTKFSILHDISGYEIAKLIKSRITHQTGLTASAGISHLKFLAKIASDWKKPDGIYEVKQGQTQEFLDQLNIKFLPGVGPVTLTKLNQMGLNTCYDLRKLGRLELNLKFGKFGKRLHELAHGIDEGQVKNSSIAKSLSIENTFKNDLNLSELELELPEIIQELMQRFLKGQKKRILQNKKLHKVKSLFVKIKLPNHQKKSLEKSLSEYPNLLELLNHVDLSHYDESLTVEQNFPELVSVLEPILYKFTQDLFLRFDYPKIRLFGLGMRYHDVYKEIECLEHFDQLCFDYN